jgi:hypothetical protein
MDTYFSVGDASVDAAIERLGLEEWVSRTVEIHVDLALADASSVKWVQAEILKTPLRVAKEWIGVYAAMDTSAIARSVRVPTLLMAGAKQAFGCEPSSRLNSGLALVCVSGDPPGSSFSLPAKWCSAPPNVCSRR